MSLSIKNVPLDPGEWIDEDVKKDTIYLHHTAGSHRPDFVVAGWNKDRTQTGGRRRIATAYVIGGKSVSGTDTAFDGVVVQCFPAKQWAFHLGVKGTSGRLDKKSIGIELCNFGPLTRSSDGRFFNFVNQLVPRDQVVELAQPFRGSLFYHRYTDAQLESLGKLLRQLAGEFGIDLKAGLRAALAGGDAAAFEFKDDALKGKPGVWTHTNVRKDKSDCSPQPNLIALLKAL